MALRDVYKVVDEMSPEQLRELRRYIEQREHEIELRPGTLNVAELLHGLAELSAGLSEDEFREIEQAMNEEYVEPLDHDE
jgi:hypothetical protein